jgi:hypothetical protein
MYGTEVMMLNNSQSISLDSTVRRLIYKLFNSKDLHVINQCQFYMFCLPTSNAIDLRSAKFHLHLSSTGNAIFLKNLVQIH